MFKKFAVLGGGSWGTAIACMVARSVGQVTLYTIDNNVVNEINSRHKNSNFLGDIILPEGIKATSEINDILTADILILAIPSFAFIEILEQLKQLNLSKDKVLLIATKGLCENPYQLFSEKIESEFDNKYGFLSGPNFAKEVADDKFAAITISSKDLDLAKKIASILASDKISTTSSSDIITVQIASIVKNIAAIKSGIMNAQNAGENAKAWLISSALEEIYKISNALGGDSKSLALPAVVGDLVLTCYSNTSRNTKFGYEFYQNNYSKEFLRNYPAVVEGVQSAKLLGKFLEEKKIKLELPIISYIVELI